MWRDQILQDEPQLNRLHPKKPYNSFTLHLSSLSPHALFFIFAVCTTKVSRASGKLWLARRWRERERVGVSYCHLSEEETLWHSGTGRSCITLITFVKFPLDPFVSQKKCVGINQGTRRIKLSSLELQGTWPRRAKTTVAWVKGHVTGSECRASLLRSVTTTDLTLRCSEAL